MVAIHKRLGTSIRQTHSRQYGKGIGTFFKSAVGAIKNTTKEIAKVAASKGKEIAKSAAGHLKDAAKDVLNKGMEHGKNLAKEAAATAAKEGQRLLAEHGQDLVNKLASAESFSDIGKAVSATAKHAAEDVKDTTKAIVKHTVADAKARALDLAKSGVVNVANAGIMTAMDAAGLQPMGTGDVGPTDDGSVEPDIESGEGMRHPTINDLMNGKMRKRKATVSTKRKTGGALFLPGGGQGGRGLYVA
jgi:hypothetical protein